MGKKATVHGRVTERPQKARASFALSDDTRADLEWIARARGVTMSEALRRAVRTERYLVDNVTKKGGQVFVETPGQPLKELLLL